MSQKSPLWINPWLETLTAGDGISPDALKNRVIEILLRNEDNLIKLTAEKELYTDLQLDDNLLPTDDLPVGVCTGRVLQANGWIQTWTMLAFKTTSWDYVEWIFWDDGKLYIDNGTGTFKQIYLKPEVDALFTQLRSEISAVWYSGDFADLLNQPNRWTSITYNVGNNAGQIPVIQQNWRLDPSIVPNVTSHTFTVNDISDLTTLSQANQWDMAIVINASSTYILSAEPYSTLANWTLLPTPTSDVTSVNGQRWDVNLTTNDVPEANNKLYTSALEKGTRNAKLAQSDVATVALTWAYNDLNGKPTVDAQLDTNSTNAVQNKAVATAVNTINNTIEDIQDDVWDIQWDISALQAEVSDIEANINENEYVTQAQYDALPATKTSDWKSYFIYEIL